MKTYWDLPEAERAQLTRDQVEEFAAAELMTKGVLKVRAPSLVPVPQVEIPTKTYYGIAVQGQYSMQDTSIAFESIDAAKAAIDLRPMLVDMEYIDGAHQKHIRPCAAAQIVVLELPSLADVAAAKQQLKEASVARAANKKAQEAYDKELAAQDDALRGMWDDWHDCRRKAERMQRIRGTAMEYAEIAQDPMIAGKFLLKVFRLEEIREAEAWLCTTLIGRATVEALASETDAPEQPAAKKREVSDDIPF